MKFDRIREFEQLNFKQWIALGTHCGGVKNVKSILQGHMKVVLETINPISTPKHVPFPGSSRNLIDFFQTRSGLVISENFQEHIVPEFLDEQVSVPASKGMCVDLIGIADDYGICGKLPKDFIFSDIYEFLAMLSSLIEKQWEGDEGVLLTDGNANIFYVWESGYRSVIYVTWSDSLGWLCKFYSGSDQWNIGQRIFFPVS